MIDYFQKLLNDFKATILETKKLLPLLGEPIIDSITDNEIIKKVPVINTAVAIYGIKEAYTLYRFKRNLKTFLETIETLDKEKIKEEFAQLKDDSNFDEDLIDTTISILIESNKTLKPKILACFIEALATKQISKDEFYTFSLILYSAMIPSLKALKQFMQQNQSDSEHTVRNYFEPLIFAMGCGSRYGSAFAVSDCGKKIYEVALKKIKT